MRTIMACATLVVLVTASAEAQVADQSTKDAITDATIINSCGARLARMFAQFGSPTDLRVDRGETPDEDDVFCSYGDYGFRVRNKVIRICFFFKGWKAPIRGVKIGDSREEVVKVLGSPRMTVKDKESTVTAYGYDLNDLDAYFFANFDKNGKVWRVEVSLK